FKLSGRTGYETLLYDVLVGDPMLFSRADQIEGGWRVVQPLLDAWSKRGAPGTRSHDRPHPPVHLRR
ncbi:MAG: hypothetical protein INR64_02090, partial [Caulobacteraceae bacterium]|nr:hypothetical protein [Caulobacter sp.]